MAGLDQGLAADIRERTVQLYEPEFPQGVQGLDPVNYLPLLRGRPLRIQQTSTDPFTPPAAQNKIIGAMPDAHQVTRYPDSAAEAPALGANGILGWLATQLNGWLLEKNVRAGDGSHQE